MEPRITAVGAAAASWRLAAADVAAGWGESAGRGSVAVCAADEDALTLAWQAASRALAAAAGGPEVDGLWWGTATPPFTQGPNLAYLAATLGLPHELAGGLLSGSAMAGVDALLAAHDAVASGRVTRALVVASDAPVPGLGTAYERQAGAAAVALVIEVGVDGARLAEVVTTAHPFLDRYRGPDDVVVRDVYDGRLFREEVFLPTLTDLASRLAADGGVDRWAVPDPDGRLGRILAKAIAADDVASATLRSTLGDTGTTDPVLGLAACLASPGTGGVLALADGRAAGLRVEVPAAARGVDVLDGLGDDAQEVTYVQVLRARRQLRPDTDPIEMAVPPGGAAFVRGNEELLGLLGARCDDCGTISTPPSVHPTCIGCGGERLTAVPLARSGEVQTFVVNTTMPAPFEAPLPLLVVDLDDGARLMVHGTGPADGLAIGDRVHLVLRRYALERGASIYGFKAARAAEAATAATTADTGAS